MRAMMFSIRLEFTHLRAQQLYIPLELLQPRLRRRFLLMCTPMRCCRGRKCCRIMGLDCAPRLHTTVSLQRTTGIFGAP